MILAGDEFADKHDLGTSHPDKPRDSVNFGRIEEPWRKRVFDYVATLVKLRTDNAALGSNDTDFIHVDFSHGKRMMVWKRGKSNSTAQVVVVANFPIMDLGLAANTGSQTGQTRLLACIGAR